MNRISVIVPAYNIENYISDCLDSILAQTYRELEILVVDDGSTDNTGAICDEYARKDDRIRVIHQANRGLSGARNTALGMAHGEYIGYVDGDDTITPDMYELMLKACLENDAELAVCSYAQQGDGAEKFEFSEKTMVLDTEEALKTYVCDDKSFHIYNSVWSKLFKRSLVEGVLFPQGRNSEDIMYTTRALVKCNRCVFIDRPLYNYVLDRSGSIMNVSEKLAKRRFEDEIPFWKEHIECIRTAGFSDIANMAEHYLCRRLMFYYLDFRKLGRKKDAAAMADIIRSDKQTILKNIEKGFVSTGDRSRMRLFLFSPSLYYITTAIYDKIIIPLRNR